MRRTTVLVVLDGWGIGRKDESNPIHVASPENIRYLEENFPITSLQASGISVGLPWGEVGNSEVGHLTLGAGKIIYQYFPRITLSIRDGTFFENKALKSAFAHAKKHRSAVNLVGLLTKANVHASLEHLEALIEMARIESVKIKLHLFADGKDSPPRSILEFMKNLPAESISGVIGRYYAMDRDDNWSLVRQAYLMLIGEGGTETNDLPKALESSLRSVSSEEFLPPIHRRGGGMADNDAVVFFNFREDSVREITAPFLTNDFRSFPLKNPKNLFIVTMTRYSSAYDVQTAFEPDVVRLPLGKVLSDAGKNQLRVSETYKYAHVTYFFNGYREEPYENEYRVLIPSLTTPRLEEHPEMMASAITDRVIQGLENQAFDFMLVNYANPDSIAHTGNYEAALAAVKCVDQEIGRLLKVGLNPQTVFLFTSDHGNMERIMNPLSAKPETQHDPNPVPLYLVSPEFKGRKFVNQDSFRTETVGIISDVAPTILEIMGLEKPSDMTGESLIRKLLG